MRSAFRPLWPVLACLSIITLAACGQLDGSSGSETGSGTIVGRLGGPPSLASGQAALTSLRSGLRQTTQGLSSVENVTIVLVDAHSGDEVATATSDESGAFRFPAVDAGSYKLQIQQDEFSQVAYAVDTETLEVSAGQTLAIGLPVVKRVYLPAYPQPTAGSPVALDQETGRVYMAIDQGLLALHPVNDTVDLLYTADGFRSDWGPRLLTYIPQAHKLLIITSTRIWIVDQSIFGDDELSEVLNYDDPASQESIGEKVDSFEVDPEVFIDISRRGDFDPHFYRFDTTSDGQRLYMAAGDQAAVIDWSQKQIARVFKTSGRMAHYAAASNRLFFLQQPDRVRMIDAETLLEVKSHHLGDPEQLLGVSSRPSSGDGYVAYTRLNVNNDEVLMLLIVDPDGNVVEEGKAATILNAEDAPMEPGVPHWQANGERFIVGDSLFALAGESFQPVATGAILGSSLAAAKVQSNRFRGADVPNAILLSFFGEENAALGFYFLDGSNPDVGIRVVRGVVSVVTLDEAHGRGIVFGNGAMSIIYYNADDAAGAEAEVDLSQIGSGLLGGAAGTPCDSTNPCPDEGVCAPVDEFNTDEGTCLPQVRTPYRNFCGGIGDTSCDPGFECRRNNPTNPNSAGDCVPMACQAPEDCPEHFFCEIHFPDECPPDDPQCPRPDPGKAEDKGACICRDETACGPPCFADADCPNGFVCSDTGHCAVDRCLSDASCPDGKVCGVTELGRACVEPGSAQVGEPCHSSGACASAYCRDGACVLSCSKTADCADDEDCIGDEWVGYCGSAQCHCGPDEICRHGFCDVGANCAWDEDCSLAELCADGRCVPSCAATGDCAAQEVCVQGPPHISGLYCSPFDREGGRCWRHDLQQPGCSADTWCSEYGACLSGTPCYEWEPNVCPAGQACIQGACQIVCASSADCQNDQECTAGLMGHHGPDGEGLLTCQPAACNCPNPDDICVRWESGKLGQCWNWTDCTETGACPDSYRCEHAPDSSYRCICEDPQGCGARCERDENCSELQRCDLASGQCVTDNCEGHEDCPDGKVCGWLDWTGRVCLTAGSRAPGAPCDNANQCVTGACVWDVGGQPGGTCVQLCNASGQCGPAEVCGMGDMQPHLAEQGILICYAPDNGLSCTDEEVEIEGACSDGSRCDFGECPWPTGCRHMWPGMEFCVCDDPICHTSCQADDDCGHAALGCSQGLCRLLSSCTNDGDCALPKVCGFVSGDEQLGPRCVAPGAGQADEHCAEHDQCASGFCAGDRCAQTCLLTSDCQAGQECRAVSVGHSEQLLGACAAADCGCSEDQVCNLDGQCGPAPLCNGDRDCPGGQVCADNFCRTMCKQTDECQPSEDCVGVSAGKPHVCLTVGCGCAADQVCDGGQCFTARPCADDDACRGGRCLSGQCVDRCTSGEQCAPGLECVAIAAEPHNPNWKERLCTTPTCHCTNASDWCLAMGSQHNQDQVPGCYRDDSCGSGCPAGYHCQWGLHEIADVQGEACLQECTLDDDCPPGAICGMDWEGRPMCVVPGSRRAGESCGWAGECRSGVCLHGWCIEPCEVTLNCEPDQVCGTSLVQNGPEMNLRSCYTPDNGLRCLEDEWEIEGACTDGTTCDWDSTQPCPWPNECRHAAGEIHACACTNARCFDSCQVDSDCGSSLWACRQNLCRGLAACLIDSDCTPPAVCGLIDDHEDMGLRCVAPGAAAAGEACQAHGDCATGFCTQGTCERRCGISADCEPGDECRAVAIGQPPLAVGACAAAECGCEADEVCNADGLCGPGPLCNGDADCGAGLACVDSFCRLTCERTAQCQDGEDCTGLSADRPHVCLPSGCGCAADQVCDGGRCFTAQPCQDHTDCLGGYCIGGQCSTSCTSTRDDCAAGLECVAVQAEPHNPNWRVRVCTVPTCDCLDDDSWCLPTSPFGGPSGCHRGNGSHELCPDCGADWGCNWIHDVEGVGGQVCACENLAACGPRCAAHSDCPPGSLCNAQQACQLFACQADADCPAGTVCGADPQHGHRARACWLPGPKAQGERCDRHEECASAACTWGPTDSVCVQLCSASSECDAGQTCAYRQDGQWPHDAALCTPTDATSCPGGCEDDRWCHEGRCHSGLACWFDHNRCADGEICDTAACHTRCDSTLGCPDGQECVLTDPWHSDPRSVDAACRAPECRCPNAEDVCRSDLQWDGSMRECVRPVGCSILSPCPTGYRCADWLNNTCICDEPACSPTCQSHADCPRDFVCDPDSHACDYRPCIQSGDCPTDTICAVDFNRRFCARPGPRADHSPCEPGQWWQCESGMCLGGLCLNPCVQNSHCPAGQTCQSAVGVGQDQNFPFCNDWADQNCGCQDHQFCNPNIDPDPMCQDGLACACLDGPACADSQDCPDGTWCDPFSRSCIH